MLVSIDRLIGAPILSLQTGIEIAKISDAIVDPRQLKIIAFYIKSPRRPEGDIVLHPEDIREISDIGMIVDSDDSLMETTGLVRLQEVIDFGFNLIGLKVSEENGHKLGRVKSFSVDPESFYIQQLYVKPSLVKSFSVSELSIRRSQIKSINNDLIIVKSATIKEEVKQAAEVDPGFVNPFRASAPVQPEG